MVRRYFSNMKNAALIFLALLGFLSGCRSFSARFGDKKAVERVGVLSHTDITWPNSTRALELALKFYRDAAVRPGCTAFSRLAIANILSAINKNKEAIEILDMTVPNLPQNLDAKHLWTIVSIYAAGGDIDRATPHLVRYLKLNPRDWRAWIHMAILYASRGQNNETLYAFQRAIEFGKTDAVRYIEGNPSLMAIAEPLFRQLRAVRQRESSVPQIPQPR
jgi:tetratricopeptide (TPR) repeat protein